MTRVRSGAGGTPWWRSAARALTRRWPWLRRARALTGLATPIGRRRLALLRDNDRYMQPATVTRADRHPRLFATIASHVAAHPAPRLLSFGCSTGEEAFSLAAYVPHGRVEGIDINAGCIAAARRRARRLRLSRVDFRISDRPDDQARDRYQAVTCLSVLRHGALDADRPATCTAILPFARFAEAVATLDACLAPGGLLVLWGCNFRFRDTAVATRYRTVPVPGQQWETGVFYGPDDRLLEQRYDGGNVFQKLA